MRNQDKEAGLTVIELLITLFIAAAFLVSGYQLYSVIIRDGGESRTQARASNLAYDYMQRYAVSASNPCVEQNILTDESVEADNLSNVQVTVSITCPYSNTPDVSKISVIIKYGSPQKEVSHATYTAGSSVSGPWQSISVGTLHNCAIANGLAYCWGQGTSGQLGNNSTSNSNVPVAVNTSGVLSGKTITAISAGVSHSCAIADGQVYCWGSNSGGQLGNGGTSQSLIPVAVSGNMSTKTATSISAGWEHSCAVADGLAYCWGLGTFGRLGNNSTSQQTSPVAVTAAAGILLNKTVTKITAGNVHSCAIADGLAYCWGWNGNGELGDSSTNQSLVPVAVNTSGVLGGKTVTDINVAASSGTRHSCAVAGGLAYCWGQGAYGKLGNNSVSDSNVPVAVDTSGVLSGKTISRISAAVDHSCAVASSQAYCWGQGTLGRLGNNSTNQSLVPVAVDTSGVLSSKPIVAVEGGINHSCAIVHSVTNHAYCWGNNSTGQLGDNSANSSLVPVEVFSLP